MNLDKLINLKSFLECLSDEYAVLYTEGGKIVNDDDDLSKMDFIDKFDEDASRVVNIVVSTFKRMIKYCALNNIEYEKLVINPSFGFFVEQQDYDAENMRINNNLGILEDAVRVDFYNIFYVSNGEKNRLSADKIMGDGSNKSYIVLFSEFAEILDDNGLDFGGYVNFYNLIADSKSLEIVVDFGRRLNLVKK